MAGYSLTEIENAIITSLEARMGSYVKTIASYQGSLPEDLASRGWRLPLGLVRLAGTRAALTAAHSYEVELTFAILVAARNLRGNEEARQGEEGVYRMLDDLRAALWDQDLGLEIEPFRLLGEEAERNDREMAAFEARYATRLIWTPA